MSCDGDTVSVRVLALVRSLTQQEQTPLPSVVVPGCEPLVRMRGDEPDADVGLSEPVRAAVGETVFIPARVARIAAGALAAAFLTVIAFSAPDAVRYIKMETM